MSASTPKKAQGTSQCSRPLVSCQYCGKDISKTLRVKCLECSSRLASECNSDSGNLDYELCGDCFVAGAVLKPHDLNHSYTVNDCLHFHLFKDWTAQDELTLLDGIDRYGMGNWKNIAENLFSGQKTVKQVEDHYWEHYMGVHGYCLPEKTIINDKTYRTVEVFEGRHLSGAVVSSESASTTIEPAVSFDDKRGYMIPVQEGYNLGEAVTRDKTRGIDTGKTKSTNSVELPGYMPLRQDFDIEYENDAEVVLATMEFTEDDHPSERALKLQVIDIYNQKLKERDERKKFVIDRNLVDFKRIQALERKMSKEERDLVARLKVFARFHSNEEHEALVDGILKASRLKEQILLYQHYRKMGIKTLEQAKCYEIERRKRDHDNKVRRGREMSPFLVDSVVVSSPSGNAPSASSSLSLLSLSGSNANSSGNLSASLSNGIGGRRTSTGRRGREVEDLDDNSAVTQTMAASSVSTSLTPPSATASAAAATLLTTVSGEALLTPKEKELCIAIGWLPSQLLAVKEALVREAFRNGTLTEEGVHRVIKVDSPKGQKVFDFFVRELNINNDSTYFKHMSLCLHPKISTNSNNSNNNNTINTHSGNEDDPNNNNNNNNNGSKSSKQSKGSNNNNSNFNNNSRKKMKTDTGFDE